MTVDETIFDNAHQSEIKIFPLEVEGDGEINPNLAIAGTTYPFNKILKQAGFTFQNVVNGEPLNLWLREESDGQPEVDYRVFMAAFHAVSAAPPPPLPAARPASRSDYDAPPPLGRRRVHRFVSSDFGKPLITRQPEHLLGLGRVHRSRADFDGVRKRAAQDGVRRPRGKWGSL